MGAAGRPVLLAAAVLAVAVALDRAGLPAPALFAGLTVGLAHALLSGRALRLPESGVTAAHGVIGVTVGVTVQPTTLSAVAGHWLPVTLVTIATLALSIGAGPLLARWTPIDAPTAALGLIAGGASGITAMSDDLGADSRIVAVLQYLRILLIVLLMPAVVVLLFGGEGASSTSTGSLSTDVRALPAVAVLAAAGAWTGRRLRLPTPGLLGPLLLTAPAAALDVPGTDAVPPLLQSLAFAVLGAHVGLRFTTQTLHTLRRALPVVLLLMAALLAANAALGLLLSALTGISPLDGYLATTPGGLYVVLAVAAGSGADTTVVLAVQVLRLLVMLVAAPAVLRLMLRGR